LKKSSQVLLLIRVRARRSHIAEDARADVAPPPLRALAIPSEPAFDMRAVSSVATWT
jgi:hypothetical protein